MNQIVAILLSSLFTALPHIVIAIVGLVLIQTRLKQVHPRAYLYGALGLTLLLANGLLGVGARVYFQVYVRDAPRGPDLANILTVFNLASFVVLTASLVLILMAILADRSPETNSRVAA